MNDIDQDGNLNLFVGGDLGGIMHFEHNPNSISGLEETKMNREILLFPNPGKNQFTLLFEDENLTKINLQISDAKGRMVLQNEQIKVENGKVTFQLEAESGVYFARITSSDNQKVVFKKLVIQ